MRFFPAAIVVLLFIDNDPVALPIATLPVLVVAIFTSAAPAVPRLVVPVEESVVKAPVEGVVAPIAVLLMPVAVTLKLPDVMSKLFPPVEIEDAFKPLKVNVPEVAVRFNAPVVCVNPLDAVNKPAEVIVPVPVVETLPLVESVPNSLIVNVLVPAC